MKIHFQPIVSMRSGDVRAIEALSRITPPGSMIPPRDRNVEWWFEQARAAHMQVPFELNAINVALAHLHHLPPKVYLSVNVSPATLSSPRFRESLRDVPHNRLFVELTEHVEIAQTQALVDQIEWIRSRGIGLAIDDVGAGYAGLSTIIRLRPNVLKLDRSLVSDIHKDAAKQSLARALYEFADSVDAFMIAEGIEKPEEHFALRDIGARLAQGYLYARPAPAFDQIDAINAGTAITMPLAFSSAQPAAGQNHRPHGSLIA